MNEYSQEGSMSGSEEVLRCGFCEKSLEKVKRLLSGVDRVCICNECAIRIVDTLEEDEIFQEDLSKQEFYAISVGTALKSLGFSTSSPLIPFMDKVQNIREVIETAEEDMAESRKTIRTARKIRTSALEELSGKLNQSRQEE